MSSIAHDPHLTASDYYRFFQCPHWPYYEWFATDAERAIKRELAPGEMRRLENGIIHERDVVARVYTEMELVNAPVTGNIELDAEKTQRQMQLGAKLIYQGALAHGSWIGRPDLLVRIDAPSRFGNWMYVPLDIKSSHDLEKYQRMQLCFYAALLEIVQGAYPTKAGIVNADGQEIWFTPSEHIAEFELITAELEEIRAGVKPDPVLRKSCFDTGPWGKLCQASAEATGDIALLFNVDVKKLRALRSVGVRTIQDAAEMDPVTIDGSAKGLRLHGLEVMKRQAQALLSHAVFVREPVSLPAHIPEIHFDIESDPANDRDYLYGFFVRIDGTETYHSFRATGGTDERALWESFLAWLPTLPTEYVVYHYSMYEMTRLSILEQRYGGCAWLEVFRSRMIDLKELVTHAVTFPLYFYGLKYIAKFLGHSWRSEVQGGGASIDAFERYLETLDEKIFADIVLYNEDDVRATAVLSDWLQQYAKEVAGYEAPYPWK